MLKKLNLNQTSAHVLLVVVFSVLAMASSFYNGVTSGNDAPQHYQLAHTVYDSLVSGELYPRWAAAPNDGYGDVAIRFYPPLAYYVLSVSRLVVGGWYGASLLAFFLFFLIGGLGVYCWAREGLPANQALLAAGLYTLAPYRLNQIYNNFLYAEFAASAVLPFCFLFVARVCQKGKAGDVLGLSIAYALLILTHLPLTIIGSLSLFVYALAFLNKKTIFQTVFRLSFSVVAALGLSSFYWLRMVTELAWVKHSTAEYFLKLYDYRENFLFKPQNILDFENNSLWIADVMLLAVLLAALPSIILFARARKSSSKFTSAAALLFFVSVFMTTPVAGVLWDNFELLQKVQFPWRWLGVVSLAGAVFAPAGITHLNEKLNKNRNWLALTGFVLLLASFVFTSTFIVKQAIYTPQAKFDEQIKNVSAMSSFECWWTIWRNPGGLKTNSTPERSSRLISARATERVIVFAPGEPSPARVGTFYYPHWKAFVNGSETETEAAADGVMRVRLPRGETEVALKFQEPVFVRAAYYFSAFGWIIVALLGGALIYKKIVKMRGNSALTVV